MIREDDKDAVVYKIVDKLQSTSLFLEMKADLQVKLYQIIRKNRLLIDVNFKQLFLSEKKEFKAICLYYH